MGFAVGVDFGSTKTKVAITKWDNDSGPAAECLRVAAAIPSVVFLGEQHELAIGEHAQKLGATDPHRVIRDFKRRVGDSVPIIADGWSESTESVIAAFVRRIVDEISDEQNATPDLVALAYPAHWGTYKQALIAGALRDAGLAEVLLVTEPAAAITDAGLPATGGVETVLVYDFGGGSFDAAVMTRSVTGEFRTVGIPQGLDWLGGDDFDQAIFSRVRDGVRLTDTVPADPEILTQMSRLREACTQAKETLSLDTEVTIPVATTRYRTRFRLVRAEFDELIRDAIEDTLDAARRVIGSAGLSVPDIDAIVLVGGSSRIPLVAQMISAEFSLPIVVDPRPEDSIALGAARLAVECLQARQAAMLPIPLVEEPVVHEPAVESLADDSPVFESNTPESTVPAMLLPADPRPAITGDEVPAAARTPLGTDDVDLPPEVTEQDADWTVIPDEEVDGTGRHHLPAPVPPGVVDETPAGRMNGPDRGRHRHRARRRYGLRTAGIVAAAAGLIFAGSSLAASQAADSNVPEHTQTGDAVSTTSPAATPIATTPVGTTPQAATAEQTRPAGVARAGTAVQPRSTTSTSTGGAGGVDAPAVVIDKTELGG